MSEAKSERQILNSDVDFAPCCSGYRKALVERKSASSKPLAKKALTQEFFSFLEISLGAFTRPSFGIYLPPMGQLRYERRRRHPPRSSPFDPILHPPPLLSGGRRPFWGRPEERGKRSDGVDGKEEEAVYLLLLLLFVKAQSPPSLPFL